MISKLIRINSLIAICAVFISCADVRNSNTSDCSNYQLQCSTAGVPQICVNEHWEDMSICPQGKLCQNGVCIEPCTDSQCQTSTGCINYSAQCSQNGVPQICYSGTWIDQTPCGEGQTCINGKCTTAPQCTSNDLRCTPDGTPQICLQGMWINQTPCSAGLVCQNGSCVSAPCTGPQCQTQIECTDNAMQCSQDGAPQICLQGMWINQTPCSSSQTCQDGICRDNAPVQTCNAQSCQNDEFYKGSACINTENNPTCGCYADSDCKSGYSCNTSKNICEIVCTDQNCAAQTSAYQGNICISKTEDDVAEKFCGCNEDKDCRDGYECSDILNICTLSCDNAACAAETKDYAGDICVKHVMDDDSGDYYIACGCSSDNDCREGYACSKDFSFCMLKGTETGSCSSEACVAAADDSYHGNVCVLLDNGYGCGCKSDNDCRDSYICNYLNQCIIENDISECKTNDDCIAKPDDKYYGNVCKNDSYDDGNKTYTFCGCSSDSDCKAGYACNKPQETCVKYGEETDTCLPSSCKKAEPYEGDTCVNYYGDILCGCSSNADCRQGYFCDLEYLECTK